MTNAILTLVVLALVAVVPAAAGPLAVAAASAPADFTAEARTLMRTVSCQGDEPLPKGFDETTVMAYCKKQSKAIATYRDRYLPVAGPFLAKLQPAGTPTTVIYPFGGGDLVSALTTYPDARDITTLSLEHAGDPRRLSSITSKEQLADSLALIQATSAGLLYAANSRTDNLMKGQRGKISGQLAFWLTALAIHGYEPVGLKFFRVEKDGTLHYFTTAEIAGFERQEAELVRGKWTEPDFSKAFSNSELTFVKKGGGPAAARIHRHIAWDLSDAAIVKTGIIAHLESKGTVAAMTKAASYLLWRDDFSRVRNFLLGHMTLMISDSTGIPPRWAAPAGFVQETYGSFEVAFLAASTDYSRQFKTLWASQPMRELSFRYGYIDGRTEGYKSVGRYHLLVTRKATVK